MNLENKKIEELTIEEWGTLFPIKIYDYNSNWISIFEKEKALISKMLPSDLILKIEHMGSTSVPGLASKGSIDIIIGISKEKLFNLEVVDQMVNLGYEYCVQSGAGQEYMIFGKGFNRKGLEEQKFYVHMTTLDHTEIWDRLYFRDYLIDNPNTARTYEDLKRNLAEKYSKDKRSFQKGKTDFVLTITEKAKKAKERLN